jgi:hypothetical protein
MATKRRPTKPRARKRTEKLTLVFAPEEVDLIARAAAKALETRAAWAYRRLVFAARTELGLDTGAPR